MNSSFAEIFNDFGTIFLSIIIEAFLFLLIGTFLASIIEFFVSENLIQKFLSKSKIAQVISASFLGLIFPICECAIIPLTRKLIEKGIPVRVAIIFLFSVPIVNPISISATYFAFIRTPKMVLYRIFCSIAVAMIAGIMLTKQAKDNVLISYVQHNNSHEHCHNESKVCKHSTKLIKM